MCAGAADSPKQVLNRATAGSAGIELAHNNPGLPVGRLTVVQPIEQFKSGQVLERSGDGSVHGSREAGNGVVSSASLTQYKITAGKRETKTKEILKSLTSCRSLRSATGSAIPRQLRQSTRSTANPLQSLPLRSRQHHGQGLPALGCYSSQVQILGSWC